MSPFRYINKTVRLISRIQTRIYSHLKGADLYSHGCSFRMRYPTHLIGGECIRIGDNFLCLFRNRIEAFGEKGEIKIEIGNNVIIQNDCHIGAINYVKIGNDVMLASKVFISDHSHGRCDSTDLFCKVNSRPIYSKGKVIIGDNVWVGEGACILPNVTIGENSVIGANSVVTKSVPANCIVAGNPARIIRQINITV